VAPSDLLLNLVKAGSTGERELFDKTVTALIAEERSKSHHVLADALMKASTAASQKNGGQIQISLRSSSSDLLLEQEARRTLDELVLPADVRLVASQLIEEQQRADLLRSYSLEPRSRMLLTGPPGNGKTSLAEAIASSLSVPFFIVRYERVVNSYLGETAKRLQELFQYARMHQCVLFFDEFDALGKEREDRQESGEMKRVLNSLLLEIDRLPSYVVLVAATNHPTLLDKAVWRRFQIKTTLPLPDKRQIVLWFELLGKRFPELAVAGQPAVAPRVRVINLSIGDPNRPLDGPLSPFARMLDWLAWKYKVLFMVSAGNASAPIELGIPRGQVSQLGAEDLSKAVARSIHNRAHLQRIISPSEAVNALAVGSLHSDDSGISAPNSLIDPYPLPGFPSPTNRIGLGFKRGVKPDLLLEGGVQLYRLSPTANDGVLNIAQTLTAGPGQKVAAPGLGGNLRSSRFMCGTSNDTAIGAVIAPYQKPPRSRVRLDPSC
jgi:predicted AAA+ superfamily ATPase